MAPACSSARSSPAGSWTYTVRGGQPPHNWTSIWLWPAAMSVLVLMLFAVAFKPQEEAEAQVGSFQFPVASFQLVLTGYRLLETQNP